jgi:hypothetical protein
LTIFPVAPIFSETLTASAFQKKSAQFSQKSSQYVGVEKVETPKAIPPAARAGSLLGFQA